MGTLSLLLHLKATFVFFLFGRPVSSDGSVTSTEVRTFLKKQPARITKYMLLTTPMDNVSLLQNHLIYARKSCANKFKPM